MIKKIGNIIDHLINKGIKSCFMATQNSSFGPIKSREKVFKHKKALKTQSYSAQIKIVILKFGKYQSKQFQVIL